jgi:hypothetical protein
MKILVYLLTVSLLCTTSRQGHTIDLYDSSGTATAYIDDYLTDKVIYLWDGKPVGYLHQNFNNTDVYGFNGKHLGWFEGGALRDNSGYVIVGTKEALGRTITTGESLKSLKDTPPEKKYREQEPSKPYFSTLPASVNPRDYLLGGLVN